MTSSTDFDLTPEKKRYAISIKIRCDEATFYQHIDAVDAHEAIDIAHDLWAHASYTFELDPILLDGDIFKVCAEAL